MEQKPVKLFTREEVKKPDENKRIKIIIHNNVIDVTDFLNEHPGGEEVLLEQTGQDATEAFEEVGHSADAKRMISKYKVGELIEKERRKTDEKVIKDWSVKKDDDHGSWKSWMIPIILAVLATIMYRFYFHYRYYIYI